MDRSGQIVRTLDDAELARMSLSQQRTVTMKSVIRHQAEIDAIRDDLKRVVTRQMQTSGNDMADLKTAEVALMRCSGQNHDVPVANADLDDVHALGRQFRAMHNQLFGFFTDQPWELHAIRTTGEDLTPKAAQTDIGTGGAPPPPKSAGATARCRPSRNNSLSRRSACPPATGRGEERAYRMRVDDVTLITMFERRDVAPMAWRAVKTGPGSG